MYSVCFCQQLLSLSVRPAFTAFLSLTNVFPVCIVVYCVPVCAPLFLRELVCVDEMPKPSVAISGTPENKREEVEMRQKEVWKDSHVWAKSTCRGWELLSWKEEEKMGEKEKRPKAVTIWVLYVEGEKWLKQRRRGDCADIWSSTNKLSGRAKRS